MTRRTLVSQKLREFRSGNPELDRQINEHLREHTANVFEKIRYFDKYSPDHEITGDEVDAGVTPVDFRYPVGNVRRYGAKGDDIADDTDPINNAFAVAISAGLGEIVFPAGTYRTTGVDLSPASGTINVNIRGEGGVGGTGVTLKYIGSGGTCLIIRNNTRYRVENIRLLNAGSGTTLGLSLRSLAAGSNHGPAIFQNIHINGFTTGAQIGTTTTDLAASELVFINFEVASNGIGVLVEGINSLGLEFVDFCAASNSTAALRWTGETDRNAQTINIHRASLSDNAIEFELQTPCHFTADGIYIEGSTADAKLIATAEAGTDDPPMYVSLRNVEDFRSGSARSKLAWPGTYIFENVASRVGAYVGDSGTKNRYHLIYRGGIYIEPTYDTGTADSLVYVSVEGCGTNAANNQGIADCEKFVFLADGTKRPVYSYPWSGTDTAIATAIPKFNNGLQVGSAALATTATDGFLYVPTCAGAPTGTPTSLTGSVPLIIDTTNNRLYFYSGGSWRNAGP